MKRKLFSNITPLSRFELHLLCVLFFFASCQGTTTTRVEVNPDLSFAAEAADPAEVVLGERLFRETRFAQFFFQNAGESVNVALESGDPVLEFTQTLAGPIPGAYAGKSMNCAACHLVDERAFTAGGGMRTYSEFVRRSFIPAREDGKETAPRNSPALVNSTLADNDQFFLHFDAEFASTEDLVKGTFKGRNFGWLPDESATALSHLVRVIREDNGLGELAQNYASLSYAKVLKGTEASIPDEYRIPAEFRVDVDSASDEEVLSAVAKLVAAYVNQLAFANTSPYDLFLQKNDLPQSADEGESALDYSRRLLALINNLEDPQWVTQEDARFVFHDQDFVFGPLELEGLKIFFSELSSVPNETQVLQGGKGNCIACHAAPLFTDFKFHNTGAAQEEYDAIWGEGAFMNLSIPELSERNANPNLYLPASSLHPQAQGPFLAVPNSNNSALTDLGVWNVYANEDKPNVQDRLQTLLCALSQDDGESCAESHLLDRSIALFKTPGLRDLGMSAPYMHTGQLDSLEDVVNHYREFSEFVREGKVRNADRLIKNIALNSENDVAALSAFLKSLNEDYE